MHLSRRVTMLLIAVAIAASIPIGLRVYLGREAEDRLLPGEVILISELRPPLPGNAFLACPAGFCAVPEAAASPEFEMPWERLREYWNEMISQERRVLRVAADRERKRFFYVQHTAVLRFPDIITVELVPIERARSSLAIYSRSRYGTFDFGANRARVERWLALLQQIARPAAAR